MLFTLFFQKQDYVGHTSQMEERLLKHNSNHKGFTGKAYDWKVTHLEPFNEKVDAFKWEIEIKPLKSRKLIEKLFAGFRAYPEKMRLT